MQAFLFGVSLSKAAAAICVLARFLTFVFRRTERVNDPLMMNAIGQPVG